jgi:hypothetical protein
MAGAGLQVTESGQPLAATPLYVEGGERGGKQTTGDDMGQMFSLIERPNGTFFTKPQPVTAVKRLVQGNRKNVNFNEKFPVKSFQSSDRKINTLFTEEILFKNWRLLETVRWPLFVVNHKQAVAN